MIRAPQSGEEASVVGERHRALVIEAQRRERLHRIEDQLLCPRELATLHRATSLGRRQERATWSVTGALDDRLDALEEGLIVDAPTSRGDDGKGPDDRLVHKTLRIAGAAYRVIARFALPQAVVRGHKVAGGDVERARFALDELLAEALLLWRAHRGRGRRGHGEGGVHLPGRQKLLASRGAREHPREIAREKTSERLHLQRHRAEAGLLGLEREIASRRCMLDPLLEIAEDDRRDRGP